jgi:hypothetical protein
MRVIDADSLIAAITEAIEQSAGKMAEQKGEGLYIPFLDAHELLLAVESHAMTLPDLVLREDVITHSLFWGASDEYRAQINSLPAWPGYDEGKNGVPEREGY